MSSITSTHTANQKPLPTTSHFKLIGNIGIAMVVSILLLSTVGCSTTQEFKPTASVIVGGHKTI